MDTLVRNTTVRFSRRFGGYEPLDEGGRATADGGYMLRTYSRRKTNNSPHIMTSFSYRRDRARKRHIFLQTYKLGSVDSENSKSRRLKKVVHKVKSVVLLTVSLLRLNSFRSCNSRSATCAASPIRIRKCF